MEQAVSSRQAWQHLGNARGVAALVVFLAHVVQVHWLRYNGLGSLEHTVSSALSTYAVVAFFVLSGFLVTHSLESNVRRNGRLRLDQYAASRLARIYPPLVLAIVLCVVIFKAMQVFSLPGVDLPLGFDGDAYRAREVVHLDLRELRSALLMVTGLFELNGPLWSLYIEIKLYVLLGLWFALAARRRSAIVYGALFAICLYKSMQISPGFLFHASFWLTGACAYYLWGRPADARRARGLYLLALACVAAVLLRHGMDVEPVATGLARWLLLDLPLAWVMAWLLFARRLNLPFGGKIEHCSYSLYLVHFPLLLLSEALLTRFGQPQAGVVFWVSVMSMLAAAILASAGGWLERRKGWFEARLLAAFSYSQRMVCKCS